MNTKNYRILGKVINQATRAGIPGLRVEAWDKDLIIDDLLGSAVTDGQGAFAIAFSESHFLELFGEQRPDIFFKIFHQNELIMTTENSVLWNVEAAKIPVVIEGDFSVEPAKPLHIIGQVRYDDGKPVTGANVRAYDKDLRLESVLGDATTDSQGRYNISYASDRLARKNKQRANVVVTVLDAASKPLSSSPVRFNAATVETVDLVLPASPRPSEYEELMAGLTPSLAGLTPSDLTDEDVSFLAGETAVSSERISLLRQVAKLAKDNQLSNEVFYGFAKQGLLSNNPRRPLSQPLPALRRGLEAAIKANQIPKSIDDQLDSIMDRLRAVLVKQAFQPETEPGRVTVGALLCASRLSPAAQEKLVVAVMEHEGTSEGFWKRLKEKPEFHDDAQILEARLTLQLGALTGYHPKMVKSLRAKLGNNPAIKDLVNLDAKQWLDLASSVGVPASVSGDSAEDRVRIYATSLRRQVEAAFPSAAIVAQINRTNIFQVAEQNAEFNSFFDAHPDFDMLTDSVERNPASRSLSEPVRTKFKHIQRLARIVPDTQVFQALYESGVRSASQFASMSEGASRARFGKAIGDDRLSRLVYSNAAKRKNLIQEMRIRNAREWNHSVSKFIPPPLPDPPPSPSPETPVTPAQLSDWFGSQDVCACRECHSVLGPAAYLTDLLHFFVEKETYIQRVNANTEKIISDEIDTPGLEVLLAPDRRADLQDILLNCQNAEMPLPYVDLVNEILERAITQTGSTDYQTTWSSDELAANPEHIEPKAYTDVIGKAIFPWNLPFDLYAEEARVYLAHLGTSRHKLMEVFYNNTDPNSDPLQNKAIAREHLKLTNVEWGIIEGTASRTVQELWGLKNTDDVIGLLSRHPQQVLDRADITFNELQMLLITGFVNWSGKLQINYSTECSLDQAMINFQDDPETPTRLCRFVRMWRTLGWSIPEVDAALRVFRSPHSIAEIPLLILSHFQRVSERLEMPIIELLAFYGDPEQLPSPAYLSLCADHDQVPASIGSPGCVSLFDAVFFSRKVASTEDIETFKKNIEQGNKHIHGYLPHVTAALGVCTDDILRLLKALPTLFDNVYLSQANLSRLYRITRLCHATDLSIPEFIELVYLIGVDKLPVRSWEANTQAAPRRTLAFLDELDFVRNSGFDILELAGLLRGRYAPGEEEASLRQNAIILQQLRLGLQKIDAGLTVPKDASAAELEVLLRQKLALILQPDEIEKVTAWSKNDPKQLPPHVSGDDSWIKKVDELKTVAEKLRCKNPNYATCPEFTQLYQEGAFLFSTDLLYHDAFYFSSHLDLHLKLSPEFRNIFKSNKISIPPNEQIKVVMEVQNSQWRLYVLGVDKYLVIRDQSNNLLNIYTLDPDHPKRVDLLKNRYHDILQLQIRPYLRDLLGRILVKQQLGQALVLDPAVSEKLLEAWVEKWQDTGVSQPEPAMAAFLDSSFFDRKNAPKQVEDTTINDTLVQEKYSVLLYLANHASFQTAFLTLTRLRKVTLVLARLKITITEASYLFKKTGKGWLELSILPVAETHDIQFYNGWRRLVDVCGLHHRMGAAEPTLFDLFDQFEQVTATSSMPDILARLALAFNALVNRTGWNPDDFEYLRRQHFDYGTEDFTDERAFLCFDQCFQFSKRLGVTIAQPWNMIQWATLEVDADVSGSIKHAARARYADEKAWDAVARPLQNALRERKRAALVGYLCGIWNWTTDQLYGHFLIDPEMSACMLTSRVKQAISSVQLFIQRIFLGIERTLDNQTKEVRRVILLNPVDATAKWDWMKNYRVWGANRKVFLFPENWIYPELRDDKSPFFKELENELRQGEITSENVEKAYINYLHKVETVSNLEIVGHCHNSGNEESKGQRVHVFGRTRGVPTIYYHRYCDEYEIWSPWQKITLDIQGDHLLPIISNGRLYLYWPIFKEKQAKGGESLLIPGVYSIPEGVLEDKKSFWMIQLASGIYQKDGWTSHKLSGVPLVPKLTWNIDGTLYFQPIYLQDRESIYSNNFMDLLLEDNLLAERDRQLEHWQSLPEFLSAKTFLSTLPSKDQRSLFYFVISQNNNSELLVRIYYPYGPYCDIFVHMGSFVIHTNQTFCVNPDMVPSGSPLGTPLCTLRYPPQDMALFGWEIIGIVKRRLHNYLWTTLNEDFRLLPARGHFHIPDCPVLYYSDSKRNIRIVWCSVFVFYHPFITQLIEVIYSNSLSALLKPTRDSELYRQRVVKPLFSGQGPLTSPNEQLDIAQPLTYSGSFPEILKPREDITFEDTEAYSLYNWEIFFHIPLLIAERLRQNQQFEEAMKWYHYIFDPLDPNLDDQWDWQRPWRMGRFYDNGDATRSIEELMMLLSKNSTSVSSDLPNIAQSAWDIIAKRTPEAVLKQSLERQIGRWSVDPFEPHLLARMRITPYMKTVVMKYLENLIDWADQLFRRDTIESINEAAQLYILAAEILGPHPQQLPERQHSENTYAELKDRLDDFSNALENEIPGQAPATLFYIADNPVWLQSLHFTTLQQVESKQISATTDISGENVTDSHRTSSSATRSSATESFKGAGNEFGSAIYPYVPSIYNFWPAYNIWFQYTFPDLQPSPPPALNLPPPGLYFCIPQNDKLMGYWDTVADRLLKIRHCMNIEGVVRELPLFEPPIDPGLLVKVKAAGVDFSTILKDLSAPAPHYRFIVLAQKAAELCQEVKALGAALLAALEKRDAEKLVLLRSEQEISLLEAVREVRKQQIIEAKDTRDGLDRARDVINARYEYYKGIQQWIDLERQYVDLTKCSMAAQIVGQILQLSASVAEPLPDIYVGGLASPTAGGAIELTHIGGGSKTAQVINLLGQEAGMIAAILSTSANLAAYVGDKSRRWDEWKQQEKLANLELKQIDKQTAAAEIRTQIAEKELVNHEQQMENAKSVDDYMRSKFTNQDLYDWMVGQISGVYFQSYQLAYDTAKRAERCYRFELGLGLEDSDFIRFGYWDSLRKGLLAAEQLTHDLKRMEMAYLEKNKREYEITKHVSLALLDPVALISLRQDGQCFIDLPEALFDLDCPGHFMRRIKSVSLTIPCVAGPYTSVNCTLTLLKNSVRKSSSASGDYPRVRENDDPRFADNLAALQSIVTSSAQNDSGLFELNFRDERYLPFEGAGAISSWRIELPREFRQFDYDTITDVILHVRYTAREGGEALREKALEFLRDTQGPAFQPAKNHPLLTQLVGELDPKKPESLLLLSAKHDFPTEWYRFVGAKEAPSLEILLTKNLFPYQFHDKTLTISRVGVALILSKKNKLDLSSVKIDITLPPQDLNPAPKTFSLNLNQVTLETSSDQLFAGNTGEEQVQIVGEIIVQESLPQSNTEPTYSLKVSNIRESADKAIDCANIDDILLVYRYSAKQ